MYAYKRRLVFGCCSLSSNKTKKRALKVLKLAENLGLKNFDTAPLYSKGYSELLIGEAFKGNKEINVTTKIGAYKVPKTITPASIALPLNNIKNYFRINNSKNRNLLNDINKLKKDFDYYSLFKKQIKNSKSKLKGVNIDSILLHEINPLKVDTEIIENLRLYLNNENINKFGYAGNLHSEIFELQIPNWIKILQLTLPYENKKYKEKIFYLLEKYSNIEFRFFNVFSEIEDKENSMSYAKKILKDFPNTKIIFQTTSQERLKYNFDFFNS